MTLNLLLAWWNLIYIIPFVLAMMYLGLYVFTGITFGDADIDADLPGGDLGHVHVEAHVVGGDADADFDHDIHAGGDADADADADADGANTAMVPAAGHATALAHPIETGQHSASVDADHDAEPSMLSSLLSMLGVGKIPLSLALMILLILWGSAGFVLNQMFATFMGQTFLVVLISVPLAAIISLTLTGVIAHLLGKFLQTNVASSHRRSELVGCSGEAIYNIDAAFGLVSVHDSRGELFQVPCRTAEGKPPIAKGTTVVLFHYDHEKGVFYVAPLER